MCGITQVVFEPFKVSLLLCMVGWFVMNYQHFSHNFVYITRLV